MCWWLLLVAYWALIAPGLTLLMLLTLIDSGPVGQFVARWTVPFGFAVLIAARIWFGTRGGVRERLRATASFAGMVVAGVGGVVVVSKFL
jgi:hypothetical protein